MSRPNLPAKPYPDFPLFAHQRGRWAKKILGKTRYFGRFADGWQEALASYQRQRDDLYAGREPSECVAGLHLLDFVNDYLEDLKKRVDTDEVTVGHWSDCQRTGTMLCDYFGDSFPLEVLRPSDFVAVRRDWIGRYALATVAGHVRRTKAMMRWGHDPGPLDTPIQIGNRFREPSAKDQRLEKKAKPKSFWNASEIWTLTTATHPNQAAMILLAINAGFHTCDVGRIRWENVDLDEGWATLMRQKTAIDRRAFLWPETISALRTVRELDRGDDLIFMTRLGSPVYREDRKWNHVSKEFGKLVKRLQIEPRRSFIALRKTFQTIGDETGDMTTVRYVMGHADKSMSATYRQHYPDELIKRVCGHVREWYIAGVPRPAIAKNDDERHPSLDRAI